MRKDVHCIIQNCPLREKRACLSVGSVYARNILCHKCKCPSKWRLCPSCILQGDVLKSEYEDKVFSIGHVTDKDCILCEFHSDYGPTARRGDKNLVKLYKREFLPPTRNEAVKIGGLEFKIVPVPLLSDFDYEIHDRIRRIVSSGLKRNAPDVITLEEKENTDSLEISMRHFYDINADILSEMEGLYSIEDLLVN